MSVRHYCGVGENDGAGKGIFTEYLLCQAAFYQLYKVKSETTQSWEKTHCTYEETDTQHI